MPAVTFDDLGEAANSLLTVARDTPREALEAGDQLLQRLDPSDSVNRAVVFRAMAIAARSAADNTLSISYARRALIEAQVAGDLDQLTKASLTLAGSLALAGENEAALEILGIASDTADGLLAAEVDFQRGAVLGRMGELARALESYAEALPIFLLHDDQESVAMTLHNSGLVYLYRGDLTEARGTLEEALRYEILIGSAIWAASTIHNLGMVAAYGGDVPEALRLLSEAEAQHIALTGSAAEIQVGHCEVLLSAGLFREALGLALSIGATLHDAGLGEDEAEARLVGAQAALLGGDVDSALRWADIAAEQFDQQDRGVWAASARLVGIQAQYQAGMSSPPLLGDAREIAAILEAESQLIPAFNARLIAGRIGMDLGLVRQAIEDLERVTMQRIGPVEIRLQSWLATALVRLANGHSAGADAAARAGMRLLGDYQAALGATDIRTGVERHAAELGELGLRLALESKQPRRVFAWMERTRARALRHRAVTPSDDHAQAADLAELRRISVELRSAEGDIARQLSRQERALQESIRNRGRLARGEGSRSAATVPDLVTSLGNRTLVEFASLDDRLWAVTINGGRFSMTELGPEPAVLDELESLRFTMRRLARGRGNASTDLAQQVAARLDEMLFGKVNAGSGPMVIVPTPALHSTPWSALLTCRGRAVTVAPSAELWWRAAQRRRRPGSVVVAAGPDLVHAGIEALEVADLYLGVQMLGPEDATVERLRAVLDRAQIGHIACHARFEVDNPMFSSLRLADGDLTVYDLERMRRVPDVVVLSACDSGFSDTHAGEELMGLSSALLSMGTRSLIASVGLVPDSESTRALMVELHKNLIARVAPGEALSRAQAAISDTRGGYVAAASFVCIGAG